MRLLYLEKTDQYRVAEYNTRRQVIPKSAKHKINYKADLTTSRQNTNHGLTKLTRYDMLLKHTKKVRLGIIIEGLRALPAYIDF